MNVESTTSSSKTTSTASNSSSSSSTNVQNSTKSFKDEMETAKTQDTKTQENSRTEAENAKASQQNAEAKNEKTQAAQQNSENNISQQVEKDKLTGEKNVATLTSDPLKELNSKIAVLNNLKGGFESRVQEVDSKTTDKSDKTDYCKIIKMDNQDITFFVNLVENQQMVAQNSQGVNLNGSQMFTDVKAEATQATVKVSATLLDALSESAKTNKPFRIDFDNNVAVVMRVDKDGVLSANFIPGSAAVENYLRNNIASLRQSFEEQNLPYNELSYSRQQKQDQKDNQSQNNKEKENE